MSRQNHCKTAGIKTQTVRAERSGRRGVSGLSESFYKKDLTAVFTNGKVGEEVFWRFAEPGNAGDEESMKKGWKIAIPVIAAAAAGAGVMAVKGVGPFGQKNAFAGYTQETAELRDIVNYRSFTGTIEPVTERNVLPDLTGVKITAVDAEEGDEVKAGDTLVELDQDNISEQIKELEATMTASEKQNALQIQTAKQQYDDYKSNIDSGNNSAIQSASQQVDSAFASLVSAQQAYNNEVELNNSGLSQTILTAMQSVDSAYSQLQAAELSESQAIDQKNAYGDLNTINGYNPQAAAVDTADQSVSSALSAYNNALTSYEAAKKNEENSLTQLFDQYVTAQESYINAIESYNTSVTQARQQLDSYSLSVQQAQASADSSVNELKLADLYRQLDECTVTAPIDGVVTSVGAKVGDLSGTTVLAVVTSFDEMKIVIKINEYDISGVTEGSPVDITMDATGDTYTGKITKISREATSENGVSYFTADVQFDGDDNARGGMSVEAKLVIDDLKQVVTVPNEAVQTAADGSAYVFTASADGKTLEQTPVTLGPTDGTYVQITDGLAEGDAYYYKPQVQADGFSMTVDDGGDSGSGDGATE